MAEKRIYQPSECVVFLKTRERWGQFSNMCAGFPIYSNSMMVRSTEHLYQAMRHTANPDHQIKVLSEPSPMIAKRSAYALASRDDWNQIKVQLMRWMLRLKIAQHPVQMLALLDQTENRPIVELSKKDPFWGAILHSDGTLAGVNALGRLWMGERERVRELGLEAYQQINPPSIPDLLLLGVPVEPWVSGDALCIQGSTDAVLAGISKPVQQPLF